MSKDERIALFKGSSIATGEALGLSHLVVGAASLATAQAWAQRSQLVG